MKNLFLRTLSKAMNAYLHLDPASTSRLKKLEGKVITIEFLPFHFIFQCVFNAKGVDIKHDELIPADTKIKGTPLQMLGMMVAGNKRHQFFAEDVLIEGNAETGQEVIQLFDELELDWEESLSQLTGDAPAHRIGHFAKSVGNWLRHVEKSFSQNISEYLHEETAWFPQREALEDYFHDVDTLRMDVDRIEAKICLLKNNIKQGK